MFALRSRHATLAKASLAALSLAAYGSFSDRSFVSGCSSGEPLVAFSPKEFRKFPITKVEDVSHNTKLFVCALPSKDHEMGMTTSGLVMIKG